MMTIWIWIRKYKQIIKMKKKHISKTRIRFNRLFWIFKIIEIAPFWAHFIRFYENEPQSNGQCMWIRHRSYTFNDNPLVISLNQKRQPKISKTRKKLMSYDLLRRRHSVDTIKMNRGDRLSLWSVSYVLKIGIFILIRHRRDVTHNIKSFKIKQFSPTARARPSSIKHSFIRAW